MQISSSSRMFHADSPNFVQPHNRSAVARDMPVAFLNWHPLATRHWPRDKRFFLANSH